MSTKQLVYEGNDLEGLIRRVIDEHGPARIHPPERRRKGGVFGFFAKEVYVVSVDSEATAEAASAQPPSHEIPTGTTTGDEQSIDPRPAGDASPLAALIEATDDELELAGAPLPAVTSPTGKLEEIRPFSEVLEDVASSLGEEPGTYRPGLRVIEKLARPVAVVAGPEGPLPAAIPSPALPSPDDHGPEPDHPPAELDRDLVDLLLAAGFPRQLLRPAPGWPGTDLESVFASLPPAPPLPNVAGALIAVVGEPRTVRAVALSAASEVGCAEDRVAVVSPVVGDRQAPCGYRARTASQAAALAGGWRRDRVGVVAVNASPVGEGQRWTRRILSAMGPSFVWGVVSSTTKVEDVGHWADAIGGIDALVLWEPESTMTPAAILDLGIPVARLGNHPATPRLWASTVSSLAARR